MREARKPSGAPDRDRGREVDRKREPSPERELGRESPPESWLRQWSGPLSTELLLEPARFGLGKVPARLKPDAIARSVCGFCSTGCGREIHIKDGAAVNLTPALEYPVNRGMACPKGWEALAPLAAPDRAL